MAPTPPRVLVTGATGFIGRPLCDTLEQRACLVHRTSRSARRWPGGTWHRYDLLTDDPHALLDAARPDVIVHGAWIAPPASYRHHPDNAQFATATLELARAASERGVARQVFIGSSVEDASELPYSVSKLWLRERVQALSGSLAWARPYLVYGPGEAHNRLIPTLARALISGEPARLGPGEAVRDFVHVDDVASALATLVRCEHDGVVDIGTGRATRVCALAERFAALAGRPDLVELGALPPRVEPLRLVADTRALRALHALPRIPLEIGLKEALILHRRRLEHAA